MTRRPPRAPGLHQTLLLEVPKGLADRAAADAQAAGQLHSPRWSPGRWRARGRHQDPAGRRIPVGRNGRVGDVADLITFLCREQTGYVTGATYDVNGGSHIH